MTKTRAAIALIATLFIGTTSPAWAQPTPAEVQDIRAALTAEQTRIAALKAELEQRSAALLELTRRLEALGGTPAPAASPAPPPERTAAAPPRFDFYGDARVRYEKLRQDFDGCVGCPDRNRGRLRLRFGAEGRLAPGVRSVIGLGTGELNDPNTVYVNLGSNFSRKVVSWDRAFIEYRPDQAKWLNLTAGKFPYTWLRSSMTFDVDFYPEGLSQRFSFDTPHAGALKNIGVQSFQLIHNEQPMDRHMTIVGGQFTSKVQVAPAMTTSVAITGIEITHPEFLLRALLDGSDVGVRNTNVVRMSDNVAFLQSGYRYANAIVENAFRTSSAAWPLTIGLEYQRNLEAATSRDSAYSLRVDTGRSQRTGDWELGLHLFRVEQDAILAGLGESDWRAPSNVLQHRVAVNRMMHPNVQLSFTLYSGRTLDRDVPGALLAPNLPQGRRDPWANRMYFDVTYRY